MEQIINNCLNQLQYEANKIDDEFKNLQDKKLRASILKLMKKLNSLSNGLLEVKDILREIQDCKKSLNKKI
jgi:hypothetical protein